MVDKTNINIHKYTPMIFMVVVVIFCYNFIKLTNIKFRTDNITKIIDNSEFAGYAVFINKKQLLTTYDLVTSSCKKDKNSQHNLYVLYNNNYYHAISTVKDAEYGLSVLELNTKKKIDIKNYTLISNNNDINKLLTVENVNDPFMTNIRKKTFNSLDRYLYSKSMDTRSQGQGSPLFDSNMSLYGLVLTKTKNNIFGIFTNKIVAIKKDYIKKFLDKYAIQYVINSNNVNLNVIDNYKDKVIAKVICVQKTERIPKIITLQ